MSFIACLKGHQRCSACCDDGLPSEFVQLLRFTESESPRPLIAGESISVPETGIVHPIYSADGSLRQLSLYGSDKIVQTVPLRGSQYSFFCFLQLVIAISCGPVAVDAAVDQVNKVCIDTARRDGYHF